MQFLDKGRWGFPHQNPPGVNLTPLPRLLTRWNFPRPRQDLFRDCLQELPGPPLLRLRPLYLEDFWLGIKNDKSQLYSLDVSAPATPLKKVKKRGGNLVVLTRNCSFSRSDVGKL